MVNNRKVFWCNCGAHMVSVEKETWDNSHETYLQFWNQPGMDNNSLRSRIRHAWAALHGTLYHDGVCLHQKDVEALIKILQKNA
jgi:hypothetical protein